MNQPAQAGSGGATAEAPTGADPTSKGDNAGEPRVRREFPETLYVNPR